MNDVFAYTDFRQFLRDRYAALKARHRHFSYRYLAAKIGYKSPALLTLVLQGKRNLSARFQHRLADAFKLTKREAAHFELLVAYSQARSHEEKKRILDRLVLAGRSRAEVLLPRQYAFCESWHHSAIRELLAVIPFSGDYAALGRALTPPLSASEARRSVQLLKELGLVEVDSRGVHHRTEASLTTGEGWRSVAIQHFQRQVFALGQEAFDRFSKEERDLSSMTVSCSFETFRVITEKIRLLRREIAALAESDERPEGVFQCNFQLFPLARPGGKRKGKEGTS